MDKTRFYSIPHAEQMTTIRMECLQVVWLCLRGHFWPRLLPPSPPTHYCSVSLTHLFCLSVCLSVSHTNIYCGHWMILTGIHSWIWGLRCASCLVHYPLRHTCLSTILHAHTYRLPHYHKPTRRSSDLYLASFFYWLVLWFCSFASNQSWSKA